VYEVIASFFNLIDTDSFMLIQQAGNRTRLVILYPDKIGFVKTDQRLAILNDQSKKSANESGAANPDRTTRLTTERAYGA
jgi:hypothetical protein